MQTVVVSATGWQQITRCWHHRMARRKTGRRRRNLDPVGAQLLSRCSGFTAHPGDPRARIRFCPDPARRDGDALMAAPTAPADLYYDPYSVDLNMAPHAVFARIREEAPLYYNEQHDFYALSRYDDVNKGVIDHETFISGRGALLEIIKSGMEIPPGTLIFEDPPIHNIHRNLLSRLFTPRKVLALKPQIREFTARCLDPLIGAGKVRLRPRPRRADADAGHRHAAGHPRRPAASHHRAR